MIGFVLVDKPPGPTSHDVVDVARRALGVRRIGHAGTLDPPASGLLVLAVGPATRLLRYVQRLPKTYETTGMLGIRTTTLDADGEVVDEAQVSVSEDALREAASGFVGDIEQVPPAVSAIKVGGERAYRRAARGEDVELKPRPVTVHALEVLDVSVPRFSMRVRCSGGTYVRSLVADIGDRLGCGAHVLSLRRTAIGELPVTDSVAPEAIDAAAVRPVAEVLRDVPRLEVDAETAAQARNGRRIATGTEALEGEVLVVGPAGAVGVFESKDGILRPLTVLGGTG